MDDDNDNQMMYTAAAAVAEAALLVVKANTVFLSGLLSAEEAKNQRKGRSTTGCFQGRRESNGNTLRLCSVSKGIILDVIPSLTLHCSGGLPL